MLQKSTGSKYKVPRQTIELPSVCSNCGAPISPANVDQEKGVGACLECLSFTPIESKVTENQYDLTKGGHLLTVPKGLDVLASQDELDMRYSHFHSGSKTLLGFMSVFTILWNGFMLLFVHQTISDGNLGAIPFMSLHILVGIALFIIWARMLLNHTDVIVSEGVIKVHTGPLALPKEKHVTINSEDVKQLYVERRVSSRTNGNPNYTYDIYALLYNKKRVKVLAIANYQLAMYVERRIEGFLHLEDQAIAGEYKQ